MNPNRWIAPTLAAVLVAAIGVFYVRGMAKAGRRELTSACGALEPSRYNALLGRLPRPAVAFKASTYDGGETGLSAYQGKVVFLNFWASWCPPCVREMPSMERLQHALAGEDGFAMLAVSSDDNWSKVRNFFARGTNLPVVLDPPEGQAGGSGVIARSYGTEKLPETYLIDKQGNVRYYFVNSREWDSADALRCIRGLLQE